jgi:hypothetical protein
MKYITLHYITLETFKLLSHSSYLTFGTKKQSKQKKIKGFTKNKYSINKNSEKLSMN